MEVVLIDRFIVPEEYWAEFLREVHKSAAFLGTLPVSSRGSFTLKTPCQVYSP